MKFYFLSSLPCLMTVNGAYFGKTDTFPKHAEVCASDEVFVQFSPENALPVGFFITEKLRFEPPERCEVYLLPDAIALYVKDFIPCDFTLKILLQKSCKDTIVTVYKQGPLQVCVERDKEMFVKDLPPSFSPSNLQEAGDFFLLSSPSALCLIDRQGDVRLYEQYESFSLQDDALQAILPLSGARGDKVKCVWDLTDPTCPKKEIVLLQAKEEVEHTLTAYTFFESILLGYDYRRFLADALLQDAEKIPQFLGNFTDVVPCEDRDACLLVYPKAPRLYQVKRFHIMMEKGKIIEIQG